MNIGIVIPPEVVQGIKWYLQKEEGISEPSNEDVNKFLYKTFHIALYGYKLPWSWYVHGAMNGIKDILDMPPDFNRILRKP